MAIEPTDLLSSNSYNPTPRMMADEDGVSVKKFDGVSGGPTLAIGTPVAFDTSTKQWVAWENGGANNRDIIRGFTYEAAVLHATNETLHQVMERGLIHYDDIALPTGEVQANLLAALKDPEKCSSFLKIQGMAEKRLGPAEA